MSVIAIALMFFIVANPIGNFPAIVAVIKDFDFPTQKKIMLRESIFALLIAFFFQYFGQLFLGQLDIQDYTVSLCGGILLLLVALFMIFPHEPATAEEPGAKSEPMIVPIATPLISGPALLTIIMLYASQEPLFNVSLAILIAFAAITFVLNAAPYIQRVLHRNGIAALEQLMGLILSMMAIEMIVQGMTKFIKTL